MDPKMAEAFRFVPYGIYVLTTLREGKLRAMIVSWVSQVSYHPPPADGDPSPDPGCAPGHPREWCLRP